MSKKSTAQRLEILEWLIMSLQADNIVMHARLTHIDDLLFVAMQEVNEHVIGTKDIAAIAEQERRDVEKKTEVIDEEAV